MTDMLLNKEVDVYIAFLLSLYYDYTYTSSTAKKPCIWSISPTPQNTFGAVYANTVIIKRQNSGKYSIDTEATKKSTRLWLCIG
jgi:hypothetical protein